MKNKSVEIYDALRTDPDLSAVVQGRIYPLMADQDAAVPLVIFDLSESSPPVKGRGLLLYDLTVDLYAETYTAALDLHEKVKAVIYQINAQTFHYQGARAERLADNEFRITQTYQFIG